ncbi:hypothetical protein V7056_17160 [Bacillus sp. JJ664]
MKKYIFIIILAIVLFISAKTNPTKHQFVVWAKDKLVEESNNKYLKFGIELVGDHLISSVTTKHDYVFFSLYEVKVLDQEIKVIGVFDRFIPISKKDVK